jgi:acetolactate synthase-1/2/3 large subunit
LITKADCVAAFGASLSRYTTDAGALLKDKRVIQCSLDGAGLGATVNVDERLVGDTELTARALLAMLEEAHAKPAGWYTPQDARRSAPRNPAGSDDRRPGTVDIEQAVAWIEDNVPKQRHLILDGGRFLVPALMGLSVPEVRSYVHTLGIGAIGLGVANAVGAWKGRPDRPALTVAGDGGFMLGGLMEFNTAVRSGVDLILFILNDGAYGAEHVQFTRLGMDPAVVEMNWPDFAPVADALGGRGFTVRGMDDFDQVRRAIEQRDRPLLIDVKLDPYAVRVDGH